MKQIQNTDLYTKLADHRIVIPVSRIQDIPHNRRKIAVDTSICLVRYFGVSEKHFVSLHNDIDARNAKTEMADPYDKINPLAAMKPFI